MEWPAHLPIVGGGGVTAGAHAAYELKEISCLRACVSGVGGPLQRYAQECRHNA